MHNCYIHTFLFILNHVGVLRERESNSYICSGICQIECLEAGLQGSLFWHYHYMISFSLYTLLLTVLFGIYPCLVLTVHLPKRKLYRLFYYTSEWNDYEYHYYNNVMVTSIQHIVSKIKD